MSKKVYKLDVKVNNSHELVTTFLTIYSTASNLIDKTKRIRPALVKVLTYYVIKGYSKETKDLILKSNTKMNVRNLNQINSELLKKGYLTRDKYQSNMKHLNESLQGIKGYLENGGSPYLFLINLEKND